jgi:hypothetical protein
MTNWFGALELERADAAVDCIGYLAAQHTSNAA